VAYSGAVVGQDGKMHYGRSEVLKAVKMKTISLLFMGLQFLWKFANVSDELGFLCKI
jgi:hypothetical protein